MTAHDRDAAWDVGVLTAFVSEYQDIVRRGDLAGFGRAYHPSAVVSFPENGVLQTTTAADFAREVADLVEQGVVVEETTRALDVTVAGDVAVIRVDFHLQIGDEHFDGTDFYSMARLGGAWVITQKLYDMAPVAAT